MSSATVLSQLHALLAIDVDSMDPAVALRYTTQSHMFHDMTSNQAIVHGQAVRPENAGLVQQAIEYVKAQDPDASSNAQDVFAQGVLDVLVCCHLTVPLSRSGLLIRYYDSCT